MPPLRSKLGIIGRNGSGKSTLLQLIAGTLTPTYGTVEVFGRVAALLELGSGFNPDFTGRENVFMSGAILGLSREEMERRFDEIAAFAGIGDFIDQPLKTYSSGMVIRLAFSVSVNVEPDILIVDEALAVGDAAFQFKCLNRLERLTRSGTALLFVSHDMGMVKTFCHHATYLKNGTERASGAPEDMAELYFMNIRDEQICSLGGGMWVAAKPSLGGEQGIAFGTDQGRIISAAFDNDGGMFGYFVKEDRVALCVELEFDSSVRHPCLSVVVQDHRRLELGGKFFEILEERAEEGMCRARVHCSFIANFAEGRYFVTVRLEDRRSDRDFMPIDKQSGMLSFEILRSAKRDFLGLVDLGIAFSQGKD